MSVRCFANFVMFACLMAAWPANAIVGATVDPAHAANSRTAQAPDFYHASAVSQVKRGPLCASR